MVRKTCSAAEEVKNLHLRAAEKSQASGKKLVKDCMQAFPYIIGELVLKCEALGVVHTDEKGNKVLVASRIQDAMPKSFQAQAALKRKERSREKAAAAALGRVDEPSDEDATDDDKIPSKYWTLGGLSTQLLATKVLSVLEPVSCSPGNLKAITKRGQAEDNHTHHMRLAEYASGAPPEFRIPLN